MKARRKKKAAAAQAAQPVARPLAQTWKLPRGAGLTARAALLLYMAILAFPVRVHPVMAGLDGSWAFAMHHFVERGFRFGQDVIFTYGPLSFLTIAMNVGNHLMQAIVFQAAAWTALVGSLAWLAFGGRVPLERLALAALMLLMSQGAFYRFGYASVDHFLDFLALVLLVCTLEARRWWLPYSGALAVTILLMFVKATSALFAISAVALFASGVALHDRRRGFTLAGVAMAVLPAGFVALYLIYNPSPAGMLRYLRASLEISSGYSVAMSLPGQPGELGLAALIGLAHVALCVALYFTRQRAFLSPWPPRDPCCCSSSTASCASRAMPPSSSAWRRCCSRPAPSSWI